MSGEFILVITGAAAAFIGAIVGLGGGFIMVPVMVLLSSLSPKEVVGTSMAVLVVSSFVSTLIFAKQKRIDFVSGFLFAVAMFPGSVLGAWSAKFMTSKLFYVLFGCFMMLMALQVAFRPEKQRQLGLKPTLTRAWTDEHGTEITYAFSLKMGMTAAFFVGYLSSLFGIGGGSVMVMVMVLFLGFPPKLATATSMFSIFCSAIVGGGTHLYLGHVMWDYAVWLAIGAVVGGRIGAGFSRRLSGPIIMRSLAVCMFAIGLFMVLK